MVFGKGKQTDMNEISKAGAIAKHNKYSQEKENNPNWKNGRSKNNGYYRKRQKKKFPEKHKAREKVYRTIKRGKLIKSNVCSICEVFFEDKRKIHGHHEDYNQPLKVVWCCKECHRELHG